MRRRSSTIDLDAPVNTPGPAKRGLLNRELIVDSALELARNQGLAGISMRRVAGELGVEPMSLYYHIPNRAALLVLMADRSVSRLPRPDPSLSWDDQLVDLLVETYQAGVDNPALFEVIASEQLPRSDVQQAGPDPGAASIGLLEDVLGLLDRAELPREMKVYAYRGLIGLLIGFIVVEVDGFLSGPAGSPAPRVPSEENPQADRPGPRRAAIDPVLERTDPVGALRAGLRWFIQGLLSNRPSP